MKVTILGAAGVRTPLILRAFQRHQAVIQLDELALMDMDGERLEVIGRLQPAKMDFQVTHTTAAEKALRGADFVITTFRVGGMESRVVDERVPLRYGVLGQETTGPGGFAMALRSIPVLLDYLRQMKDLCPQAWLLNFANPSGLMAEAALNVAGWRRAIGICDAPSAMAGVAAALMGVPDEQVFLDYFGLNHLGWIRRVMVNGQDVLPDFLAQIRAGLKLPDLPFSADLLTSLGMIPNEYLYYYYHARQAVHHLQQAEQTRGEYLLEANRRLFADLKQLVEQPEAMQSRYQAYLEARGQTYMAAETGIEHGGEAVSTGSEGYAGVALEIIAALSGRGTARHAVVNVANAGAIDGMAADDVVEIPVYLKSGLAHPLAVGEIPDGCLGLMKQLKAYEKLTVRAATTGSYADALQALAIHPLVGDAMVARRILDDYITEHGDLFPRLR